MRKPENGRITVTGTMVPAQQAPEQVEPGLQLIGEEGCDLTDVEQTAKEFGRVVVHLPEHNQVIILDDTLIGPGMIKQFDDTPHGYMLARRFAVRLCEEDETSEHPFETLRAESLAAIQAPAV